MRQCAIDPNRPVNLPESRHPHVADENDPQAQREPAYEFD